MTFSFFRLFLQNLIIELSVEFLNVKIVDKIDYQLVQANFDGKNNNLT